MILRIRAFSAHILLLFIKLSDSSGQFFHNAMLLPRWNILFVLPITTADDGGPGK